MSKQELKRILAQTLDTLVSICPSNLMGDSELVKVVTEAEEALKPSKFSFLTRKVKRYFKNYYKGIKAKKINYCAVCETETIPLSSTNSRRYCSKCQYLL